MVKFFNLILKSARPVQWIKNLAIFTGLVFTGWFFIPEKFSRALSAFFVFSILTSSVYIFNDILDASSDRLHPLKKNRPIASGKLPLPIALFVAIVGFFTSLFLATNLSFFFFSYLFCLSCSTASLYLIFQKDLDY